MKYFFVANKWSVGPFILYSFFPQIFTLEYSSPSCLFAHKQRLSLTNHHTAYFKTTKHTCPCKRPTSINQTFSETPVPPTASSKITGSRLHIVSYFQLCIDKHYAIKVPHSFFLLSSRYSKLSHEHIQQQLIYFINLPQGRQRERQEGQQHHHL